MEVWTYTVRPIIDNSEYALYTGRAGMEAYREALNRNMQEDNLVDEIIRELKFKKNPKINHFKDLPL